jgi:hypothetical protein
VETEAKLDPHKQQGLPGVHLRKITEIHFKTSFFHHQGFQEVEVTVFPIVLTKEDPAHPLEMHVLPSLLSH